MIFAYGVYRAKRARRGGQDFKDEEGLRADCQEAAWMGYTGKITIHPNQIEIVNEIFSPSAEEIEEAEQLLAAFEEAQAGGRMAFSFNGQMVDVPHLTRAQKLVARAEQINQSLSNA